MKKENMNTVGTLIAIKERLCSDKVQPTITKGTVLRIEEVGQTKTGAIRLICIEHNATAKADPKRVTVNADRFKWEGITEREVLEAQRKAKEAYSLALQSRLKKAQEEAKQKAFKKDVENTTRTLIEKLQFKDHAIISIVPLLAIEMVWVMAEECRKYCAKHKISEVLKVTRGIKHLREEYDSFLAIDLKPSTRSNLTKVAKELLEDRSIAHNMQLIRLTIQNAYFRQYPSIEIPYIDLRVEATLGFIFIEVYKRRVDVANRTIREKTNGSISQSVLLPIITDRLRAQFDALLGQFVLKDDGFTNTFLGIMDKCFTLIDFQSLEGISKTA